MSDWVNGSSITAIMLLLLPNFNLWKINPFVKDPPTHAIAAIPIASPCKPNIAVNAIELKGEVQIILIIPPNKNPITKGDCSAAAAIVPPIVVKVAFTAGSTKITINLAKGAIARAPNIIFSPSGSLRSIIGDISPTI